MAVIEDERPFNVWEWTHGGITQIRRDLGYNRMKAPADHPRCQGMIAESPFSTAHHQCGQPSMWMIRRAGFNDFFLCDGCAEGWP